MCGSARSKPKSLGLLDLRDAYGEICRVFGCCELPILSHLKAKAARFLETDFDTRDTLLLCSSVRAKTDALNRVGCASKGLRDGPGMICVVIGGLTLMDDGGADLQQVMTGLVLASE